MHCRRNALGHRCGICGCADADASAVPGGLPERDIDFRIIAARSKAAHGVEDHDNLPLFGATGGPALLTPGINYCIPIRCRNGSAPLRKRRTKSSFTIATFMLVA